MSHVDSQFSSVAASPSFPLIPIGTYRIRSKNSKTYLDCSNKGFVSMQQPNHGASQEWTISPAADGDYEIKSQVGYLGVNRRNHLVCDKGARIFTWNIDPRGPDTYMIGDATNELLVIQLPTIGSSPVIVDIRNNETRQRWSIEPASASGAGSSGGNTTGNTTLQVHNTLSAGYSVFAVPGFTWNVPALLSSIDDLPIGTRMMICGPDKWYIPVQADFEALQVARWALDCFVSAVPITHPGDRGSLNYNEVPFSAKAGRVGSLGAGWAGPYVFQRLLDIASLHPVTRAVPIILPSGTPGEVPLALQNATSSWDVANRNLFSFCFRLHQALVQAQAAIVTGIQAPLSTPNPATNTTGFPSGTYFEIRARGSNNVLKTYWFSNEDGAQIQLWPRPSGGSELRAAAFFIDRTGALCHGSGLNVDVVDNYPVVRHRRPVMNPPNHWSHPFPRFSYENSQIRIRFYSDPALPSCSEYLYPDESWRNSQFVLTRNSEQIIHAHPLSDFQPWALRVPFSPPTHSSTLNSDIKWRIVVEPRFKNTSDEKTVRHFIRTPDEKTLWDIIPLRS